jgi:D-alanine-D-alanine ligase
VVRSGPGPERTRDGLSRAPIRQGDSLSGMTLPKIPRLLTAPVFRNIAVLLGDPRLQDHVKPGSSFSSEDADEVNILKETLRSFSEYQFTYLDNHKTLMDDLRHNRPDFVMNFCDNGFNNDPRRELHIPALLEMLDIPYSGAGPDCLLLSYDKGLVSKLAQNAGVPVPEEQLFTGDLSALEYWRSFPAMVKPNAADNSIGITEKSVVQSTAELKAQILHLVNDLNIHDILIQEFLPGTEYRVTIMGNPGQGYVYLPIFEWDYSELPENVPHILTYDSKYDVAGAYDNLKSHHSTLSPALETEIRTYSEALFARLNCRDCAKIDYRMDAQGKLKLVEFNPNPSWDSGAYVNQEDIDKGYLYPDILRLLIEVGQLRYSPNTSFIKRSA